MIKVHVLKEGHKKLRKLHCQFDVYLETIQILRKQNSGWLLTWWVVGSGKILTKSKNY